MRHIRERLYNFFEFRVFDLDTKRIDNGAPKAIICQECLKMFEPYRLIFKQRDGYFIVHKRNHKEDQRDIAENSHPYDP